MHGICYVLTTTNMATLSHILLMSRKPNVFILTNILTKKWLSCINNNNMYLSWLLKFFEIVWRLRIKVKFNTHLVRHKPWELYFNALRTGDADLRFYITTVQDGRSKSAFLTRACFPCTIHLIMQYIEPVFEWSADGCL